MSDRVSVVTEFKRCLVLFLDELIETFPSETDFISLRILVKDQIPPQIILDAFVEDLAHVRELVSTRNESFFVDGNPIFIKLDRVDQFKRIWTQCIVAPENRHTLWAWFDQFIQFADSYKKHAI